MPEMELCVDQEVVIAPPTLQVSANNMVWHPVPPRSEEDYSNCVPATIPLGRRRFLSTCRYKKAQVLKGLFWHLEDLP